MAKTNLLLIAFFLLTAVAHGRFLVKVENSDLLSKRFPSETSSDNGEATIIKLPSDGMENEVRTKEVDSADPIIPSDGEFSEEFHHHHHHHRFFWRRLWHHVFSHCHRHHRFHRFHHRIRPEVDALEREYVTRRSEPDDDETSARHIPFYLLNEENVNTGPFPHQERHFHHLRRLPGKRWIPAYRHEDQDGEMEVHAVKSSYPTDFESLFEIMKEKNEDLEDERNLGQEPSFPAMFEHDKMKHRDEDKDEKFEHSFPVMLPGDHHREEEEEKEEEEKSFPMRMMQEHHHHHHHHDENEVEPEGFPMKMHEHHHHHHGEERQFPADSGSGFKKTAGEEEGGVGRWFQKLVKYFE